MDSRPLELSLFGGFRLATATGDEVDLSVQKGKSLLAWLALQAPRPHPREQVATLLWPHTDTPQARHSLRQLLTALRRETALTGLIDTDGQHLRLDMGSLRVDALRFDALMAGTGADALAEAIGLYHGELLEGFNPRSEQLESWLVTRRSHYREKSCAALRALIDDRLAAREPETALRYAVRLSGIDPLNEAAHRDVMRCHARLGRNAEALRHYRRCQRLLHRELGVAPEAATQTLARELIRERIESPPSEEPVMSGPPPADDEAVLRPAVVLCLELELGELAADASAMEESLSEAISTAIRQLGRFGATVLHQANGTLTAAFGMRRAGGDEAGRALRAALNLRELTGERLPLRCGIVSGMLLCRDGAPVGNAAAALSQQASRLAVAASAGEVRVSSAVCHAQRMALRATQLPGGGEAPWSVEGLDAATGTDALPAMVGRRREMALFESALLATMEDGDGQCLLVRGDAGIGKSRLLAEYQRTARRFALPVSVVNVFDFGVQRGEEPAAQLLRALLARLSDSTDPASQLRDMLGTRVLGDAEYLSALALLDLPLDTAEQQRFAALGGERLEQLQAPLAARIAMASGDRAPLLLAVEDIHWAEKDFLAMLARLGATLSELPVLLVLTTRIDGEPLDAAWRAAMQGTPLATIDLGPLRPEEALVLARRLAGDAGVPEQCAERSGGNPLFLEQLTHMADGGCAQVPDSVQSIVSSRLDALSRPARTTALAASVLGQRFDGDALGHMREEPATHELVRQRLLTPTPDGFQFSHALVRDGVYATMLPDARRALHGQAASWYRDRDPALWAEHLVLAGAPDAGDACLDVADRLAKEFRFADARRLLERATTQGTTRQAAMFHLAGTVAFQTGAGDQARAAFTSMLELADSAEARAQARVGLASVLTLHDRLDDAMSQLDLATNDADASGNPALLSQLHNRRGDLLFILGRTDECLTSQEAARRHAETSGDPLLLIRAEAGLGDAYYMRGRMLTAEGHFDRCLALADRQGRRQAEAANLAMRSVCRLYGGRLFEGIDDAREAISLSRTTSDLRGEALALGTMCILLLQRGDFTEVADLARQSLALAESIGSQRFQSDAWGYLAEVASHAGEHEEAERLVHRAFELGESAAASYMSAYMQGLLARTTRDAGTRAQALQRGEALLARDSISHNHLHFRQFAIEALVQAGDHAAAVKHAAALRAYTRDEPLPWAELFANATMALAALTDPSIDAARSRAGFDGVREAIDAAGLGQLGKLLDGAAA